MKKLLYYFPLLILFSCNNELFILADPGYMIPEYRFNQKDESTNKVSLYRRYFVDNYSSNKIRFDSISLSIMCTAINNDSLFLSKLEFAFVDGVSKDWYVPIVSYTWVREKPNELDGRWGESPNYERKTRPFDCPLNENYPIK